jgi:pyruvate/2-oxoacid:ferredoxin oxidoreductase alpha subunit
MMPRFAIAFTVLAASLTLSSCGTTSSLQGAHGAALTSTKKFSKVTVQDFKSSVSKEPERVSPAKVYFADHIATELKKRGKFSSVARNAKPDANTLLITGTITKYEEGSVAKRMLLGMGFGMAVFEATVEFRDNKGVTIGTIKVDKNSWPLGGVIGAVEKPEDFMEGAAEKVAEEAGKLAK